MIEAALSLLTRQEAARALHVTPETLSIWGDEGRGPPRTQIGRRWLYPKAELEAFIAQNRDPSFAVLAERERVLAIHMAAPIGFDAARDDAIQTGMSASAFVASLANPA